MQNDKDFHRTRAKNNKIKPKVKKKDKEKKRQKKS